jgi:hypothetical protein
MFRFYEPSSGDTFFTKACDVLNYMLVTLPSICISLQPDITDGLVSSGETSQATQDSTSDIPATETARSTP